MKYLFSLQVAAMITLGTPAMAQSPDHANHRFSGAEHWAKVFDDPARDQWQKPHDVISALKLAPDAAVADIGAGTGYFAVRFAHMLAQGRVYGVDLEPDMVKYLAERAKKENLATLTAVAGAHRHTPPVPQPQFSGNKRACAGCGRSLDRDHAASNRAVTARTGLRIVERSREEGRFSART
jgi:FkbM family methyltransferase